MTDCDSIKRRIDDYLDDRLDSAALNAFEQHLAVCPWCHQFVAGERTLIGDISALGGVADRIAAAPVVPVTRPSKRSGAWRAAAAIALVFTIGYGAMRWINLDEVNETIVQDGDTKDVPPATEFVRPAPFKLDKAYVSLSDDDDRLAVRIPSDDPRVHVVWLYDGVSTERNEHWLWALLGVLRNSHLNQFTTWRNR